MVNQEIFEGLKQAISRGEALRSAMMSFYNAGYPKEDIEDVSLVLDFSMLPFSTVGSAEQSADGIDEDDTETFDFTLKAGNDAKPGDYLLRVTAEYSGQKAFAKLPIKILPAANISIDSICPIVKMPK